MKCLEDYECRRNSSCGRDTKLRVTPCSDAIPAPFARFHLAKVKTRQPIRTLLDPERFKPAERMLTSHQILTTEKIRKALEFADHRFDVSKPSLDGYCICAIQ
jgi:hypothetical protein